MIIKLEFDAKNRAIFIGQPEKNLSLTSEEKTLIETVYSFLADHVDVSKLGVEKRSDNYTSIIYDEINDFLRFKYTARTKWISLHLPKALRVENENNPLFSAQKNKHQLHWKSSLTSLNDLEALKPFIIASCTQ